MHWHTNEKGHGTYTFWQVCKCGASNSTIVLPASMVLSLDSHTFWATILSRPPACLHISLKSIIYILCTLHANVYPIYPPGDGVLIATNPPESIWPWENSRYHTYIELRAMLRGGFKSETYRFVCIKRAFLWHMMSEWCDRRRRARCQSVCIRLISRKNAGKCGVLVKVSFGKKGI